MVTSVNPSALRVLWQPPPEIDHNGLITGYVIEYTRDKGLSDMVNVTNKATHIISGLVPVVTYSVRVAAITVSGTGPYSDALVQTSGEDGKAMSILSVYFYMFQYLVHHQDH